MLLDGHWANWTELRYRSFCGGCAVEGTMAVPLLGVFGPTIVAWKLVPLFFHGAVVVTTAALANRLWGAHSALLAACLWLGAPAIFQEIAAIGWGNHAEVMALVFGALLVLGRADSRRRAAGAGVLLAFAFWFCRTGILAVPAALAVIAMSPRSTRTRVGAWFVGALLVGQFLHLNGLMSPSRELEPLSLATIGEGLLAAPGSLLRWCFGSAMVSSLWRTLWLDGSRAPVLYGVGFAAALGAGIVAAWNDRGRPAAAWVAPLLLLSWGAGMVLGYTHWADIRRGVPSSAFALRYLAPGFAISVLLVAGVLGGGRRWPWRVVWLLPLVGLGLRLSATEPPRFDLIDRPLPTQLGRIPEIEQSPLGDLGELVAGRLGAPPEMRAVFVRGAVERLFQARLDSLAAGASDQAPERAQELRRAVETGAIPNALDQLTELAGGSRDLRLESFMDSLADSRDRRAGARYIVLRFCGPDWDAFPRGDVSDEVRGFRSRLTAQGQESIDEALGELTAESNWRPGSVEEARSSAPTLDGLPTELHRGACLQMAEVLGELAVISRSEVTLAQLVGMAPGECATSVARRGIAAGAWTAGGCGARPDLVEGLEGERRCDD